jgi:hypothetical protein
MRVAAPLSSFADITILRWRDRMFDSHLMLLQTDNGERHYRPFQRFYATYGSDAADMPALLDIDFTTGDSLIV